MINKFKTYLTLIIAFPVILYSIFRMGVSSGKDKQEAKQILKGNEKQKKMRKARKIHTSAELDDELRKGTY